jgi:hypothetical protein
MCSNKKRLQECRRRANRQQSFSAPECAGKTGLSNQ